MVKICRKLEKMLKEYKKKQDIEKLEDLIYEITPLRSDIACEIIRKVKSYNFSLFKSINKIDSFKLFHNKHKDYILDSNNKYIASMGENSLGDSFENYQDSIYYDKKTGKLFNITHTSYHISTIEELITVCSKRNVNHPIQEVDLDY